MTIKTILDRWGLRGGTATDLATVNEVPLVREGVVETDTGRIKVGTGAANFNSLLHVNLGFIDFTGLAEGYVPAWDAANSRFKVVAQAGASGSGGSFDPAAQIDRYEDWFNGRAVSSKTGSDFVTDSALSVVYLGASGGSAAVKVDAPGQSYLEMSTGGSGGYARAVLGGGQKIMVGGGEITLSASITLPILSDTTNRFQISIGLCDAITSNTKYLEAFYRDDFNSGNWRLRSRNIAPNETNVDTCTVGPAAGVEQTVKLVINAAGTSVEMFIDNVSMAVLTTNIPITALAFFVQHSAISGSARICNLRWMRFQQTFTTPR